MKVQTFVFFDLETTGLPEQENNTTKITEISFIAVKREHLMMTTNGSPSQTRVQNKLTLCLNPGKQISPESTEITGLCNFLLENESYFNNQVFEAINVFIGLMSKPVCIIAHNGDFFDFPILKAQLEKLGKSLSDDIVCIDSLNAFKSLLEQKEQGLNMDEDSNIEELPIINVETNSSLLCMESMKNVNESTPKKRCQNEAHTPNKRCKRPEEPHSNAIRILKAKKNLFCKKQPKKKGYKLEDIYKRLFNISPAASHRAENDCIATLECSLKLSEVFVDWVDQNCKPFADVKPMSPGVRIGV